MKKIFIFAIAALTTLSVSGCKDFLDVKPEGTPTTSTYFANDDQAVNAVKSIYAPVYDGDGLWGREIYWEQTATCMFVVGRTKGWSNTLSKMVPTGEESPLSDSYAKLYSFQARANWIVSALLAKEKKTELTYVEKRSLGEAYFQRGFLHFALAYRHGCKTQGVPAVKWEEFDQYDFSIPPQQPTVMDNYDMCIKDFEKAVEYLPRYEDYSAAEIGRAHKAAAVGMMARVYSYWAAYDSSKWDNVIACVNELETTYGRGLAKTYHKLFDSNWTMGDPDGWWGPEYIWSFPGNGGHMSRAGVEMPGVVLENTAWGVFNGWGQCKPSLDAYREMLKDGEGNERLKTNILEYGDEFLFPEDNTLKTIKVWRFYSGSDIEAGFQINKWMEPFSHADFIEQGYVNESGDWPTARVNWHVIRFADCLLLRAEANLAKGNVAAATADINKVRVRSNLEPITSATWTDIYHERYCELAYEFAADHFGDLRRWAISGDPEIKALAIAEMEKHPDVRHYVNRRDPDSALDPNYDYETPGGSPYDDKTFFGKKWEDYKVCLPYSPKEISKSAGALKQNPGW